MKVVVADLGIGNLHSLRKALEACGAQVTVTPDTDQWLDAAVLALPGVGAYGAGMRALEPVRDALRGKMTSGAPVLGVCLGLQLMLERSDEDPEAEGLGFMRGDVKRFMQPKVAKVPHMGWSRVRHRGDPAFAGIAEDSYFYFVHSYYPDPEEEIGVAETNYGVAFQSVLRKANTLGAQFHPEKSGPDGLRFLSNWLQAAEAVL